MRLVKSARFVTTKTIDSLISVVSTKLMLKIWECVQRMQKLLFSASSNTTVATPID